jgi:hypothetical protein
MGRQPHFFIVIAVLVTAIQTFVDPRNESAGDVKLGTGGRDVSF